VVASGVYDFVGLGNAAVIEPSLLKDTLLNPDLPDDIAIALPYIVRGQWLAKWIPVKGCRQWIGDSVLLLKYEKVRQWAEK
jgi:hypothetical protein